MLGIHQCQRMNARKKEKLDIGRAGRIPPLAETSLTRVGAVMIAPVSLPSSEQGVTRVDIPQYRQHMHSYSTEIRSERKGSFAG